MQVRSVERVNRACPTRREASDLVSDSIDVALGQKLTDAPHVPVQGQECISDVVRDLAQFLPGRQALRSGFDTPQRVQPGIECVPERVAVTEAPGHGDGLRVQRE